MDDQPFLAYMLQNTPSSVLDMIRRETLRLKDDDILIAELIAGLSALIEQHTTQSSTALPSLLIPAYTMLGQWLEVYCKALHRPAFIAWAERHNLQLSSLTLRNGVLHARVTSTIEMPTRTFALNDDSAWWEVAAPLIDAASVIDTGNAGLPYLPELGEGQHRELPLGLALPFYGYPAPKNHFQAQVILNELLTLKGFPSVDDSGYIKSVMRNRLDGEYQDYQALATALESLADGNTEPFDWLQIYSRRLTPDSGSMLSATLKDAARLLKTVTEETEFLSIAPADPEFAPPFIYAFVDRAIVSINHASRLRTTPIDRTTDSPLNQQWDELERLATLLQTDITLDASLSLAALMNAYGFARPQTVGEARTLASQLRSSPQPSLAYVNDIAYSLNAISTQRKYVAALNDRYTLQQALHATLTTPQNGSPFDRPLRLDADSSFNEPIGKGVHLWQGILEDPAFTQVRAEHAINTDQRLVVNTAGRISSYGSDDKPRVLAVTLKQITTYPKYSSLIALARQSGGELSSDGRVSLRQMLNLYQVKIPNTVDQTLTTARLLAIPALKAPAHGNYWTALQVTPLQPGQRQQVLEVVAAFLPNQDVTLFDYLGAAVVGEKTKEVVRAEADILLNQLLASPRARTLASRLQSAVAWYGEHATATNTRASRNALLLAALILSVDAKAGMTRAQVLTYDLTDQYTWGLSFREVRQVAEAMIQFKITQATIVPLAAHLLLAGTAPEFLVRGIPEELPYLCSHTWVHFKQYVDLLEREMPGASRAMTLSDFINLIHFVVPGQRIRRGSLPIIDWAVANGILPPSKSARSRDEINRAIDALNQQISLLQTTVDIITQPDISLRESALQGLRKVYPDSQHLNDRLWAWVPDEQTPAPAPADSIVIGKTLSLVELYMAGRLDNASKNWQSNNPAITYEALAQRFALLPNLAQVFGVTFDERLAQVRSAYLIVIKYWLSQLSYYSREALEYGELECLRLSQPGGADDQEAVGVFGRFGTLVCCRYRGDVRFYEFFPKSMMIIARPDLTTKNLHSPTGPGFDWAAYNAGREPNGARQPGLLTHRFALLPRIYGRCLAVPNTFMSARSLEIATTIVDQQLLLGSTQLSRSAKKPVSLAMAIGGQDPWATFLSRLAPPAIK